MAPHRRSNVPATARRGRKIRCPRAAGLSVAALLALAACGGGESRVPTLGAARTPIPASVMPASLLGYAAGEEDVSKAVQEAGDRSYVSSVRLWSLREGTRLRATLQVARFEPDAPATDAFQRRVVAQVGGSAATLRRVDDQRVWVSAGNRQVYYSWFRGPHLLLLAVPADTTNGRAVLRAAIREVNP